MTGYFPFGKSVGYPNEKLNNQIGANFCNGHHLNDSPTSSDGKQIGAISKLKATDSFRVRMAMSLS